MQEGSLPVLLVESASVPDWDAAPANPKKQQSGRAYSPKAVDAALLSTTLLQGVCLMRTKNLGHTLAALRYVYLQKNSSRIFKMRANYVVSPSE